ncbi:hypothetical protein BV22DRAFT_26328 [Leucogyrophana mollusca]|uniref:Uncharacterized protein n=1 Tax=Leucogyrophana mollusca TaxID=85980 RepID=A0ACB8BZF0_9AGAM|nr:hypothetical protein BV22DRAFT_26328 [Leucogyrophana mollusca]
MAHNSSIYLLLENGVSLSVVRSRLAIPSLFSLLNFLDYSRRRHLHDHCFVLRVCVLWIQVTHQVVINISKHHVGVYFVAFPSSDLGARGLYSRLLRRILATSSREDSAYEVFVQVCRMDRRKHE